MVLCCQKLATWINILFLIFINDIVLLDMSYSINNHRFEDCMSYPYGVNWLRMVVCALRSEVRRLRLVQRPCTSSRWVQGRSQGTALCVSDLHNARKIIPNLFHHIDLQIIKQMRPNNTKIEADILCINLTPNPYKHSLRSLSISVMTSQSQVTLHGAFIIWYKRH